MATTTYTWDIAAGLPVILQENDVRYIWGAHGLIAQVDATPDWHYYHADGLGSTRAVTDDIGAVEQTYEYDVYGAVTGGSGSLDNSFQFAGEQVDATTGLQYLRARYYDAETGRFISRDPIASSPGAPINPFSYVRSNPANAIDPTGLCVFGIECPDPSGIVEGVLEGGTCILIHVCGIDLGGVVSYVVDQLLGDDLTFTAATLASEYGFKTRGQRDSHWEKHKNEFPEFKNADEYVRGALDMFNRYGKPGVHIAVSKKKTTQIIYDDTTKEYLVLGRSTASDGSTSYWIRSFYKAEDGLAWFERQTRGWDKFGW